MSETEKAIVSTQEILSMVPVGHLKRQLDAVKDLQTQIMVKGSDYDTIPGTNRPTLLKSGAERLLMAFNLSAIEANRTITDLGNGHREYVILTRIVSKHDGRVIGEGSGSCSTMESKYRWRNAQRKCPKCGAEAIKQSNFNPPGYYCYNKIGGCGAKFKIDDPTITDQVLGRIENTDIADVWNTVLKMAQKRSIVAATLISCAVSHMFTQDMEELRGKPRQVDPDTGEVHEQQEAPEPPTEKKAPAPKPEKTTTFGAQDAVQYPAGDMTCEKCSIKLTSGQKQISVQKYGRALCPICQKSASEVIEAEVVEGNDD